MMIASVLRSGGEYTPEHVEWLKRQIPEEYPFVCFSDVPLKGVRRIAPRYLWPGWFSKMELFNPELVHDDILYFDLDTIIINSPEPYLHDDRLRMLSDFYHPHKPASGMMFIPHRVKSSVWSAWMADPARWMRECRGDQDVLERICGKDVARFGQRVKSYKVHIAAPGMPGYHSTRSQGNGLLPADTDIVCFHGYPRPWDASLELVTSTLWSGRRNG